MSIEGLKQRLPGYAADLASNLDGVMGETLLTPQQAGGVFVAAAIVTRSSAVIRAIIAEFAPKLSPKALEAAKAAASLMGMTNIYYSFAHMAGGDYLGLPVRLKIDAAGNPDIPRADFELWKLAASAIQGCELCVRSHERHIRAAGLSAVQVQAAVRIAAVVHAMAVTLDAEEALTDAP